MKVASQEYRPADFSLGQIQEMMVTLGKTGFSPEMAAMVANAKSGMADKIVGIFEGGTKTAWLKSILGKERRDHRNFFGQEFDLTSFQNTLEKHGTDAVSQWQKLRIEPHFLPEATMTRDASFPGWKVRPGDWYYESVSKRKVLRRQSDGQLVPNQEAFKLEGITVLVDARLKPSYEDGKQMFKDDSLLGPIVERLRREGKIAKYEDGPQSSRFGISAEEWEGHIRPALAEFLGMKVSQVRLERVIEANIIPQLYPHMPRKDDGKTNVWVWYEENFGDASYRLCGGDSRFGGLSSVDYDSAGDRWDYRALRPLVVLGD